MLLCVPATILVLLTSCRHCWCKHALRALLPVLPTCLAAQVPCLLLRHTLPWLIRFIPRSCVCCLRWFGSDDDGHAHALTHTRCTPAHHTPFHLYTHIHTCTLFTTLTHLAFAYLTPAPPLKKQLRTHHTHLLHHYHHYTHGTCCIHHTTLPFYTFYTRTARR